MTGAAPGSFPELPLFVWLSPAFPVGGFAYSHGLEAAVEAGLVTDAETLDRWVADLLACGSIRQDELLLAAAWRAVGAANDAALTKVNALALALCVGRERRLETAAMGTAFVTTLGATWTAAVPTVLRQVEVAYPVAVGAASAAQRLDLAATAEVFALAFVANLVSAAVRLGAIGQTDGQRVTLGAMPAVRAVAAGTRDLTLDDLGGCAFRSDLAALQHETQ